MSVFVLVQWSRSGHGVVKNRIFQTSILFLYVEFVNVPSETRSVPSPPVSPPWCRWIASHRAGSLWSAWSWSSGYFWLESDWVDCWMTGDLSSPHLMRSKLGYGMGHPSLPVDMGSDVTVLVWELVILLVCLFYLFRCGVRDCFRDGVLWLTLLCRHGVLPESDTVFLEINIGNSLKWESTQGWNVIVFFRNCCFIVISCVTVVRNLHKNSRSEEESEVKSNIFS